MAVFALAIALALQAEPPPPPFDPPGVRWIALPAGPTVRTEYDPASVRREGGRVTVTLRSEPLAKPDNPRLVAVMMIDCPGRAYGLQVFHTYSPAGVYLRTQRAPSGMELQPLHGGGLDELHDAVCRAE